MTWFELENVAEIPSPSLILFADRVRENLTRMCRIAGTPERLRPHVKTHKIPQVVDADLKGSRSLSTLHDAEVDPGADKIREDRDDVDSHVSSLTIRPAVPERP